MKEGQKKGHLIVVLIGVGLIVLGVLGAIGTYQKYARAYDQPGMTVPQSFSQHREANRTIFLSIFLAVVSQLGHLVFLRPGALPVVIVKDPKLERQFDEC